MNWLKASNNMLEIEYAPNFIRIYKKLDPNLKVEVKEKIAMFLNRDNHQALKVHKLGGRTKGAYAFYVNYKIRITFDFKESNRAELLLIGDHDHAYR